VPNIFAPQSSAYQVKASFDSWAVDGVNHNFAAVAGGANFHYLGWVVVPSDGVAVPVFTNHYLRMMGS